MRSFTLRLGVALSCLVCCSPDAPKSKPNVLLVTLDTTRADHLGCYGREDARTPNLDRLAETGVVFENAVCQAPLTLPSHASILTGTYPPFHGVRDNGGFYLDDRFVTLAEVLKDQDYATAAFIGAFVLDARWGLAQGFDHYDDAFGPETQKALTLESVQRRGEEVANAWIERLDGEPHRPRFSWIHFYDPHTPYDPPEPYKSDFRERPYDGEIAYVDSQMGRVLDALRRSQALENTLIVVVGDHGESLGQHEESGHGFFVYDATILVPLIVRFPSARYGGARVTHPVETVDIVPTILEILDIPTPRDVQGRSLLTFLANERRGETRFPYFETYFPLYHYGWSSLRGVRSATHKYIEAPQPELYDLREDPLEQINIYEQAPELAGKLEARLRQSMFAGSHAVRTPRLPDDEALEKLMALGYVGGFHSSFHEEKTGRLADPKDKIGIYNRIRLAEQMFAEGRIEDSLSTLNQVIREDPVTPQARQVRAQISLKQESYQRAIEDCLAALEGDPEYRAALYTLAHAYKMTKDYERSVSVYENLTKLDPNDYKPPLNLGKIHLERGEVDRAVSYLSQSVRLDPERSAMAHNLLGAAYIQKGMFPEASREIQRAIELRPWVRDAHYNLGLIYDRQGDIDSAIRELQSEIALYPQSHLAHFHLARLYEQIGDHEAKIRHLEKVVQYKEDFAHVYLMLGKSYLDLNRNLEEALRLTKKGLELAPEPDLASFGHLVLADIYNRLGQYDKYEEEKRKGEELRRRLPNQ